MKKIFLTSNLGCSYKVNGIRVAKPIDNENKIIEQIKTNLSKENIMLFICSSPDDYERNDNHAKITFDSFNMSGFNFKKLIIIDHRYNGNIKSDIKSSDLIFLAGGHTLTEMKFFEEINLRELLENYNGVIIGQSAGSLNLADTVVCGPECDEEIGTNYIWKGLGKTSINIEPHFILNPPVSELKIRKELLDLSIDYDIYAICDGSHIFDNGVSQILYGEGYLINNKKVKKICSTKKFVKI